MPRPLFDVDDLRIAVADDRRLLKGDDGPVTEDGEQLGSGWVEVLCGASYGVHEGEILGLVGESASGKSLMLLGAFGLLSYGARVVGGTTRYKGHEYEPFHPWQGNDDVPPRRERKKRQIAGAAAARYTDDAWAKLVGADVGFLFQNPIGAWTPDLVAGKKSARPWKSTQTCLRRIEQRVLDVLGEVSLPKSGRLFTHSAMSSLVAWRSGRCWLLR